jgi:NADPH-dependent curcumin reductase CurA
VSAPAREIALRRDIDHPPRAEDFELRTAKSQTPGPGEALLRVVYLSLDPYIGSVLRGRHMGETRPRAGDVVPGRAIGEVVASNAPGLKAGDYVRAETGWRSHAIVRGEAARVVSPCDAPLSAQLGVAGMPGLTAYAGMRHLAKVAGGEHALVSSAAGGVGGAAGQIARILGAERVVGIAGSPEKCALATGAYGFDACIDYKRASWRDDLKKAFPRGIDVYFDNVGGEILEAALANLANYGRIVLCGLASQYQADARPAGPNPGAFIAKRAQVFGLVVYDYEKEQAAFTRMAGAWIREGRLAVREDRASGLENAPALFERLMRGENVGKAIVAVGPERA